MWESCAPLPSPRKWCAAAAIAGHIYVLGGWGHDDDTLDLVTGFDPWIGVWEPMPPLLWRRGAPSATSLGTRLWALGGQDGDLVHRSAEVLDLATGAWAPAADMITPRYMAASVELSGRLLAIGGYGPSRTALGRVECYDAQLAAWVELPPLITPRAGLAAAAWGGRAFALGGCDASGHELCSLECFDPQVGAWQPLASMVVSRWGLGAAACAGRLYALGGTEGMEGASIGACERYCLERAEGSGTKVAAVGSWSFVGCLRQPRRLFGAAVSR
mmetsp:Transcript_55867/g.173190  ORF Transcript_55867/g.173190 Transcript_55867/m.173190 type:complete len:273 (+) Transcript_55867:404-1222(+)